MVERADKFENGYIGVSVGTCESAVCVRIESRIESSNRISKLCRSLVRGGDLTSVMFSLLKHFRATCLVVTGNNPLNGGELVII